MPPTSNSDALKAIADGVRKCLRDSVRNPDLALTDAGRLFIESVKAGAFPDSIYAPLRARILQSESMPDKSGDVVPGRRYRWLFTISARWLAENTDNPHLRADDFDQPNMDARKIYRAVAWAIEAESKKLKSHSSKQKSLPPISEKASEILELLRSLPPHKGMTLNKMMKAKGWSMDESAFRKNVLKHLKHYGLRNKRGVGYYLKKSS